MTDVQNSEFSSAVFKILLSAIRNAFSTRKDGTFSSFIRVEYSDSTPMVTVGGAFLVDGQKLPLHHKIKSIVPFLKPDDECLY